MYGSIYYDGYGYNFYYGAYGYYETSANYYAVRSGGSAVVGLIIFGMIVCVICGLVACKMCGRKIEIDTDPYNEDCVVEEVHEEFTTTTTTVN